MLLAIKDKSKGILGYFVIALISIPFTLWGIHEYLGDDTPLFVAKVNDMEISTQEFNRFLSMQRQALQRQYNGKIPFDESVIKKQVLEQLISRRLLQDTSVKYGYRITNNMLFTNIKNNESFMRDGVFDREYYDTILAANGMNSAQYEHSLRGDMQVDQLQYSIMNSAFVTEAEIRQYAGLEKQTREFSYLIFNAANTSDVPEVTADDIREHYENNSHRFMSEEKVSLEYLELKADELKSEIDIDESRIAELYEDYKADIEHRQERKARHILLTVSDADDRDAIREQLQGIKQQLSAGASFEVLAKEFSQDPGSASQGGDLDWVARGQMVKPFEQALYALDEGAISEIVESQFGYHLIKLDEIRGQTIEPLEKKRGEFVEQLTADLIDNRFYDVTDNLAAISYENADSLEIPAEVLGLKLQTTGLFSRAVGNGIAKHDKVREVAFSSGVLENAENSDIVEIAPGHVVVVRVQERVPARVKPLEDVSAEISELLQRNNSENVLTDAADAAKEKILSGASMESLATDRLELKTSGAVNRRDIKKLDFSILEAGFSMIAPSDDARSLEVVKLRSGDVALVSLDRINTPEQADQATRDAGKKNLLSNYSATDFAAMLASITDNADIYRNNKILEQ